MRREVRSEEGRLMPAPLHDPHRDDDELRILRWLATAGPKKLGEIRAHFAARMGRRVRLATERLRVRLEVEIAHGLYHVTEAGKTRAATPRPRLPVLPERVTPQAGFACTRLGTSLRIEQCVVRYGTRGDDACGCDADGQPTEAGCPVGAEAARALAEYIEREEEGRHARRVRAA